MSTVAWLFYGEFGSFTEWRGDQSHRGTWTMILRIRTKPCSACLATFRSLLCIFIIRPVFRNFKASLGLFTRCLGCFWITPRSSSSCRRRPISRYHLCNHPLFPSATSWDPWNPAQWVFPLCRREVAWVSAPFRPFSRIPPGCAWCWANFARNQHLWGWCTPGNPATTQRQPLWMAKEDGWG